MKPLPARRIAVPARLIAQGLLLSAASLLASCSNNGLADIDPEPGPTLSVCAARSGIVSEIPVASLPLRIVSGDYAVNLVVDKDAAGDDGIHFKRITDALGFVHNGRIARGEAESAACRITISVPAGVLNASASPSADPTVEHLPLVIDVPDVTLRGALRMQVDANNRATGESTGGATTAFAPSPSLKLQGTSSQTAISERTIIINGHPDGTAGNGAIVEGFVFQSGRAAGDTTVGGQGIGTFRVKNVVIRGNRFDGGFNSSVDLQASSATVEKNKMSGRGSSCDVCLAGPGDYVVRDNRILDGGIPGVLILPTGKFPSPVEVEPYVLPATALVTALVDNNEVTGHLRKPVGVGLRVGAIGVGASKVAGMSRVTFSRNNLVNNTFGIIIEAAFVDTAGRRGDIEVTTSGNTISRSCQSDMLVTLSNSQTGIGIQNGLYLMNSSFDLKLGGDIAWGSAWFANAAGFGNSLKVNGEVISVGVTASYDPVKSCT